MAKRSHINIALVSLCLGVLVARVPAADTAFHLVDSAVEFSIDLDTTYGNAEKNIYILETTGERPV